ncbi:MAG: radical SAM family heme chaperone HemW [Candidatus Omnitrophota bacterium]|nr:radical SAM family heme chaperone HemW [Candidatus Omnitrophota bacterium]
MLKSLYVHIPFCRKKCEYCNFYSVPYDEQLAQEYCDCIAKEIRLLKTEFSTVYLGGGTPSVLSIKQLQRVFNAIKPGLSTDTEFSIECNPESLTQDKADLFFSYGVNRVTLGAQSFDDNFIQKLGRIHSIDDTFRAISFLKQSGFSNIGIDLIFGIYGQFFDDVIKDVSVACTLGVQHISAYILSYEENTPLCFKMQRKEVQPISDAEVADMYQSVVAVLAKSDYLRYEVSNFAINGYESKHNLNYWDNGEYVGIGAGAVGYLNGIRSNNIADVPAYIARSCAGESVISEFESLGDVDRAKETAAFKIRTAVGISFKWFFDVTGFDFMELENGVIESFAEQGFIEYYPDNDGIKLTDKGFLFADSVSMEML